VLMISKTKSISFSESNDFFLSEPTPSKNIEKFSNCLSNLKDGHMLG